MRAQQNDARLQVRSELCELPVCMIFMDFDLHFGSCFGPKIDVFEKFLLPHFELQLEVRIAKIVILPRENAVFYKIDILALKWQPMKNIKKTGKTSLRNQGVFSH